MDDGDDQDHVPLDPVDRLVRKVSNREFPRIRQKTGPTKPRQTFKIADALEDAGDCPA